MRGLRPFGRSALSLVVTITLVLGILLGSVAYGLLAPAGHASGATGPASIDRLYLTIAFNPGTGHDEYFPANFTVPADTPVLVTITCYDNASNPVPNAVGEVKGTVGGVETITNETNPNGFVVSRVNGTAVSHTFTLNSPPYDLNVPVPPAPSKAVPVLVTFGAYFNATGSFMWQCLAPCDPVSMATMGLMMGTVTVVNV
ncbi:MAG TPA: hypothetical protein VEY12_08275 [Thermoplasmata archaeon]|nr:hypothetical protein [Thermoplasmata archaeon]